MGYFQTWIWFLKNGLLIYVKLYQRHSFSRSESENEMARDREREVKMKKNPEKRDYCWWLFKSSLPLPLFGGIFKLSRIRYPTWRHVSRWHKNVTLSLNRHFPVHNCVFYCPFDTKSILDNAKHGVIADDIYVLGYIMVTHFSFLGSTSDLWTILNIEA